MTFEPLVSIIIPSNNYGAFLAESIESALAQTHRHLEIIVVDDGSTDDSVKIAKGFEPDVTVLEQPNQGVIATCNRGVNEASGEFFTFLSSDDSFESRYVQTHLAALRASEHASFAYSDMRLCGAQTGFVRSRLFSPIALLRYGNYINGSALTLRSAYLEVGGYATEFRDVGYEDWEFWVRMVAQRKRGTYVPEPLLNWRRHSAGSRDPSTEATRERALSAIRSRHRLLYDRLAECRDPVPTGVSRIPGLKAMSPLRRQLEEISWRSFVARAGDAT